MQKYIRTSCAAVLFVGVLGGMTIPAWSQDKPANNLEIIHEKLKADKKLIVAKYMELTESEAKRFWPVYEDYQNDLQKIHERLGALLSSYAADYRSQSLTDEKARKLLDEWISLEQDEVKQRSAYASKVVKALPGKKAARYLQIENEYRMLMRYDLAATVPLVQ
jgi:alpha-galactosidase/6-phospho-beta-glucosidase family protein